MILHWLTRPLLSVRRAPRLARTALGALGLAYVLFSGLAGLGVPSHPAYPSSPNLAFVYQERAAASPLRHWTRTAMTAAHDVSAGTPARTAGRLAATTEPAARAGLPEFGASAPGLPVSPGSAWPGGGLVARTTGRVFFTLGDADYSCSGSTVAGTDLVVTAGHCVSNGAGSWATNWEFVPGYQDGEAPYGSYTARTFVVSSGWAKGAEPADDVAFVVLNTANVRGAPRQAVDVVGGQQLGFGSRSATTVVFGYPAEPPYDGSRLDTAPGRSPGIPPGPGMPGSPAT